jgi:TolB protein
MANPLLRTSVVTMLAIGLLLGAAPAGTDFANADPSVSISPLPGSSPSQASDKFKLRSAIAFSSTRDYPTDSTQLEIYLMLTKEDGSPDPTQTPRLTNNSTGEAFAALSPDGKRIVFDSNRLRTDTEPVNTSDLFVMNADDSDELQHPIPDDKQLHLTRGSSASWSPDSKKVAFHASASGMGQPISTLPGAATADSDIFVMNMDDCLDTVDACQVAGPIKQNITNNGDAAIDDDPDWSPDGTKLVFTSHPPTDTVPNNYPNAEIYVMAVNPDGTPVQDGTPNPQRLTNSDKPGEERAPAWSPNGERILFSCRRGSVPQFQLCVLDRNEDGTWVETQLTTSGQHLTATWSPDGTQIVFHRLAGNPTRFQLFLLTMNLDGTCVKTQLGTCVETQLTDTPGLNGFANWGEVRVRVPPVTQIAATASRPAARSSASSRDSSRQAMNSAGAALGGARWSGREVERTTRRTRVNSAAWSSTGCRYRRSNHEPEDSGPRTS